MSQIAVAIRNNQSTNYNVHVYDLFGNGRREVDGSPFALASGEASPLFGVNASSGDGRMRYQCDGGPSLDLDVEDGRTYDI